MNSTVALQEGSKFVVKQMSGTGGTPFPKHSASLESVLVVVHGSCTITFLDGAHELRVSDTFVVPADEVHQIVGTPDFTAVHVMPKDIRFSMKS